MKRNNCRHAKSYKIIGKNIRKIRIMKDLSQEELAYRVASTRNYIGCIERGEKYPSLAFILDIASVLGCKLKDLVEDI